MGSELDGKSSLLWLSSCLVDFFCKLPNSHKRFAIRICLPFSNLALNVLTNDDDRQQDKLKESLRSPGHDLQGVF